MFIKIYDEIPEEAKTIREAVFINEQGFKDEFDEIDDVAKHVLLFEGDIPVGTCRFFFFGREELLCYRQNCGSQRISWETIWRKGAAGRRKSS